MVNFKCSNEGCVRVLGWHKMEWPVGFHAAIQIYVMIRILHLRVKDPQWGKKLDKIPTQCDCWANQAGTAEGMGKRPLGSGFLAVSFRAASSSYPNVHKFKLPSPRASWPCWLGQGLPVVLPEAAIPSEMLSVTDFLSEPFPGDTCLFRCPQRQICLFVLCLWPLGTVCFYDFIVAGRAHDLSEAQSAEFLHQWPL